MPGTLTLQRALAPRVLYITEGEVDALVLVQMGLRNVVSVPNGAPCPPQTIPSLHHIAQVCSWYRVLVIRYRVLVITDHNPHSVSSPQPSPHRTFPCKTYNTTGVLHISILHVLQSSSLRLLCWQPTQTRRGFTWHCSWQHDWGRCWGGLKTYTRWIGVMVGGGQTRMRMMCCCVVERLGCLGVCARREGSVVFLGHKTYCCCTIKKIANRMQE